MSTQKQALRAEARRARSMMSLDADAQKTFVDLFLKNITPKESDIVAVYWPIGREFDTHILVEELWQSNVTVALPVMQKGERVMRFAEYRQKTELEAWQHDILQPVVGGERDFIAPNIVVVPLLAFDRRGNRLGYGGGYYDATLASLKNDGDVVSAGVGYAKQACLFNLPVEDHDVALDWVITEQLAQKFT